MMFTHKQRHKFIEKIRTLPEQLETVVSELTDDQLTTPHTTDEWTVTQTIHHVADAHMNSFIRMKLTLTADKPIWQPLDQELWAKMADYRQPARESLMILKHLHRRWAALFESLEEDDWQRVWVTPAGREITVESQLQTYANHGETHLAQIKNTLTRQN